MTKIAGSGSRSISQRHGSEDPDPYQMSWIRYTDEQTREKSAGKHEELPDWRQRRSIGCRARSLPGSADSPPPFRRRAQLPRTAQTQIRTYSALEF
jgi:hypothetical protein